MNFYLSALDEQLKHPDDKPSVGLILCRSKDGLIAEYALRGMSQPIGVSSYQLPPDLQKVLPTPEALQQALQLNGDNNE
jgi:YhcG PDDEXK nuclease domain